MWLNFVMDTCEVEFSTTNPVFVHRYAGEGNPMKDRTHIDRFALSHVFMIGVNAAF